MVVCRSKVEDKAKQRKLSFKNTKTLFINGIKIFFTLCLCLLISILITLYKFKIQVAIGLVYFNLNLLQDYRLWARILLNNELIQLIVHNNNYFFFFEKIMVNNENIYILLQTSKEKEINSN